MDYQRVRKNLLIIWIMNMNDMLGICLEFARNRKGTLDYGAKLIQALELLNSSNPNFRRVIMTFEDSKRFKELANYMPGEKNKD